MQQPTVTSGNVYGCVIVRLSDRLMLGKVPGMPSTLSVGNPADGAGTGSTSLKSFSIPNTVWAELVSKCAAPHFRTSSFLTVLEDDTTSGSSARGFGFDAKEISLSFHVLTDDALGFAILGDQTISRRDGHAVLNETAALFRKMFVESPHQLTPRMVDVFTKPCRELLLRHSKSGGGAGALAEDEKLHKVKSAVDEVKNLALDNVERALNRGGKIDDIVNQTDELQFQARGFQQSSRELRDQLWWNSMKGRLIVGGVAAAFVALVLFTFFYGGEDKKAT